MKKLITIFLTAFFFFSCSTDRYLLKDKGKDKKFISNIIIGLQKDGKISEHPMLVIDGIPYRYEKELKENKLYFAKSDIDKLQVLKTTKGIEIYGDAANDGVIVITTKTKKE